MNSLLQACLAAAVTLALYAFYCFWEADRENLVQGSRRLAHGRPRVPHSAYHTRRWWAAAGAVLLTLGCLASAF